jgi:hypothetical protein
MLKTNAGFLPLLQEYAGILVRQGFHKMYILHILAVSTLNNISSPLKIPNEG